MNNIFDYFDETSEDFCNRDCLIFENIFKNNKRILDDVKDISNQIAQGAIKPNNFVYSQRFTEIEYFFKFDIRG